jgi:hypothetical protein
MNMDMEKTVILSLKIRNKSNFYLALIIVTIDEIEER